MSGFTTINAAPHQRPADKKPLTPPSNRITAYRKSSIEDVSRNVTLISSATKTSPRLNRQRSFSYPDLQQTLTKLPSPQETKHLYNNYYRSLDTEAAQLMTQECQHDIHTLGIAFFRVLLTEDTFKFLCNLHAPYNGYQMLSDPLTRSDALTIFYTNFVHTLIKNKNDPTSSLHTIHDSLFNLMIAMITPTEADSNPMSIGQIFEELETSIKEARSDSTRDSKKYSTFPHQDVTNDLTSYAKNDTHHYQAINLGWCY
jgi:hypothetical protein